MLISVASATVDCNTQRIAPISAFPPATIDYLILPTGSPPEVLTLTEFGFKSENPTECPVTHQLSWVADDGSTEVVDSSADLVIKEFNEEDGSF